MPSVNGLIWLGASAVAHGLLVLLSVVPGPATEGPQARLHDAAQPLHDAAQTLPEGFIDVSTPPGDLAEAPPARVEPAAAALERSVPESPQAPAPRPATEGAPASKPTPPAAKSRGADPPRASKPEGEDWLSIDDQLPESAPAPETAPRPEVDPIVERLLAAERRKAEAGRQRALAEAAAIPAPMPPLPVAPRLPDEGPQDLAERFTRAVTEAEKANPVWAEHPLGRVGKVKVRLVLDEGKLGEPEFERAPPPLLENLVEKTLRLLRRGNFALPFTPEQSGSQWFEIEVRVSVVNDVNRYAYEKPTRTRPGRAYFVLPNGRSFEAFIDPNAKAP